uniref:Bifunctional uridylyltransferase/uridylyl-removing enzyme n=1 Tax=Candidatus Kentrum sp. TUN TaxID=2126343 RepID=A0A451AEL4_9GAMM|nr:MAG: UTP--GlnB (protein PII) uridylyltransferase, GlnD [Candidatus Kentron sp. TUN]VFK64480.1 MAG: UTP--GlnB (protein PII) uridylyltransferase, GlnD [Candidatus Kentron sp. TUN]
MNSLIDIFRNTLKADRKTLNDRFLAGESAEILVRQQAERIDALLSQIWHHFQLAKISHIALVAVGGYGRGELHPGSDIDLVILIGEEKTDSFTERKISEFVTMLWDIGLDIGHSTRTLRECKTEAIADITIATNLMEARLIEGSPVLFGALRECAGPNNIWPSREFFEAKWAEQQARHQKFHNTANNLEPNVKEGPGGLRDIHMIGWVAKRHFGANTLQDLIGYGFLTESEYQSLMVGQNFLWNVRFALHILAGRREDRLLFDYQRTLADKFGYQDQDHNLAVEHFMKQYYRTIGELSRLNEMLLELFREAILYADSFAEIIPIGRYFQARNGFLEVTDDNVFKHYPFALLELFLILQQHPTLVGVHATTIRLIRDHRYLIGDRFRADIRARSLFLEILRQPHGITGALRRMHRYGILGAYLPVFNSIVGQMQYDLFHVYTVDEHTLFVVSNLRAFATIEQSGKFSLCAKVFAEIPKRELLYIAGLFHDVAKGRGGDHSKLGAEEALRFCLQHAFSQYDAMLVAWLVEHHLFLSTTSQRKDIYDPEVINNFAAEVRDRRHLDYLYLLTVADIRGTNPDLWNDWKHILLRDLYEATLLALRRGLENPIEETERISETKEEALCILQREGILRDKGRKDRINSLWQSVGTDYFLRYRPDEIAWHTRTIIDGEGRILPVVLVREGRAGIDIFVYTQYQDRLFHVSTTILDRLHLTIQDARIVTADNGMTFNSYVVLETSGDTVTGDDLEYREREIRDTLTGQLRFIRDTIPPISRLPKRQLRHFTTDTTVLFHDNDASRHTIMEVSTSDQPGLLSQIAEILTCFEMRLHKAKIATFGERAVDIFFITDKNNQPLIDSARECLRAKIIDKLA